MSLVSKTLQARRARLLTVTQLLRCLFLGYFNDGMTSSKKYFTMCFLCMFPVTRQYDVSFIIYSSIDYSTFVSMSNPHKMQKDRAVSFVLIEHAPMFGVQWHQKNRKRRTHLILSKFIRYRILFYWSLDSKR